MKKTILFTAILLLSISTFAQARFGMRAGANISKLTNLDTKNKTDFYLGAFLAIKINNTYTLQPEFTYTQQGGTLTTDKYILNSANVGLKDININFLSIGIMNKLQANNNIHFLIGPFVDFRLDDNVNNDDRLFDGLFPRIDIGIALGLGYNVTENFIIEARFKHGFVDMIYESNIYENSDKDQENFNQVFQLGIAYRFDFKGSK